MPTQTGLLEGGFTKQAIEQLTGKSTTQSNKTTTQTGQQTIDRFDPASRDAFTNLLNIIQGGGSQAFQAKQKAGLDLLSQLQRDRGQYSQQNARASAQGDVSGLTRQALEQFAPQITGASEAAGASSNALQALLLQDLASRTGEAQSRVVLQAINDFAANQRSIDQQIQQGASGGDELSQLLLEALNLGKGSFEKTNTTNTANEILSSITNSNQTTRQETFDTTAADAAGTGADQLTKVAILESLIGGPQYTNILRGIQGGGSSGLNIFGAQQSEQARRELAALIGL